MLFFLNDSHVYTFVVGSFLAYTDMIMDLICLFFGTRMRLAQVKELFNCEYIHTVDISEIFR